MYAYEPVRVCAHATKSNSIEPNVMAKRQVDDRKHNAIYDVDTKNRVKIV